MTAGIKANSDGSAALQVGGSDFLTVTSGGNTTFTQAANLPNTFGFKNRIINGNMVIDQRNAGASVTPAAVAAFPVDRWGVVEDTDGAMTAQRSTLAPAGFTNSLLCTTTTADASLSASQYTTVRQFVEGFNVADLGWGSANAQTVTLSFWVRSSITGTFSGALGNSAYNRSYPFDYTISAANTWEYKTVLIPGDTSGTWLTDNGLGIRLYFSLGAGSDFNGTANTWNATGRTASTTGTASVIGTLNATFYITGVQLEKGSTATSFDYRPYGTELQLCQRYYYKNKAANASSFFGVGQAYSTTKALTYTQFPVSMRTNPSAVETTGTATDYRVLNSAGSSIVCSAVPIFNSASTESASLENTVASGLTAGNATFIFAATGASGYLAWSAEL